MRIKNSFDAADEALCRAHSAELRRDMDERQDMMQEIQATELLAFLTVRAFEVGVHMPTDAPAAAEYSVCIKEHVTMGLRRIVGQVAIGWTKLRTDPQNWLPCDKSGWVSHTPTADSGCPVPAGLEFKVRFRNGHVTNERRVYWGPMGGQSAQAEIVAWSPTGAAA